MTTFYRATLILERVEPDEHDDLGERRTEIGAHTVTGDTAADAMVQLCAHADSLHDWHVEQADDEPMPLLDEAVRLGPPAFDLSKLFKDLFVVAPKTRHVCAICGKPGPIAYEGNTWVCAPCNAITEKAKDQEERAEPAAVAPKPKCGVVDPNSGIVCAKPADHAQRWDDEVHDHAHPFAPMPASSVGSCAVCSRPRGHSNHDGTGEESENNALLNAEADAREAEFRANMQLAQAGIPYRVGPPCGAVSPFGGSACIKPAGHLEAGDPVHDDGDEREDDPAFVDTEADRDEEMRAALAACGDVYRTGGGSSYACSLKPGHEGPHLDGPQGDVAWRNTGWRGVDGEPGQEGAEAEDDPAFVDTEADRDEEMRAALANDPFAHCHVPVAGGYCHRPYRHEGACSTMGDPVPNAPAEAGVTTSPKSEGEQQQ